MSPRTPLRERICLDRGWRFAFGHAYDSAQDFGHGTGYFSYLAKAGYGDGPARADFDDRAFRELDVPHDWAVELPFAANGSHSHGYKALGRNFPETSVGWYRKRIFIPEADLGRRISVEFEGVFRNSDVFVNGFFLGREPSGYAGFEYDLSDYLNYGADNFLVVRVDATVEEGWFYEGAGIYRHVWLHKTAPLHVAPNGTFVTTEIAGRSAKVSVLTSIRNQGPAAAPCLVEHVVLDPHGRALAKTETRSPGSEPGDTLTLSAELSLEAPELWSLETPALHTLITRVLTQGSEVDEVETRFGIRSLRFDANHGFFLNEQHVLLKGTNNHQDHAGVGCALPDSLQDFRILALKAMGSNAYRCSHNPPTKALLDACDRLGMLVIDETRSMGSSPSQLSELERMIARDRNHPSVILWSLGNEEWAIEGDVKGARIARTMHAAARRLDPTRRTTVAISGGWGRGISTVADVMGYNYIAHGSTDRQHADFPEQPGVGTEETTTQGTRGVYVTCAERAHSAPVAEGSSGGNAEIGWKHYAARPYLAGIFFWTGFDYRGESNPYCFPAVSSQFGILDTCGFPKDGFYYLKSWWSDEPTLHVFPHWNWPGREGERIEVWAFSNAEEVELWLNGQSQGRKSVEPNGHVEWQVGYQPGELLARAFKRGREIATQRVATTGSPSQLRLSANRTRFRADAADTFVVGVSALDDQGQAVPTADNLVEFAISGPGRILGVGNGDPSCHEPDRYLPALHVLELGPFAEQAVAEARREFRVRFESPALEPGSSVRLLLRHFGAQQSVSLDGQLLASFEQEGARELPEIALSEQQLPAGVHELLVVASAYRDDKTRERAELVPAARLRIDGPPPVWKRSLFNGLLQVIVQSSGEPGAVTLRATSTGLRSGEVSAHAG
ncbi:MAG TPA: beta-galactosidase GalA [Polyangiaceae bacterium]|nr:beta-galactosidase GalA [Polyangiaceae bacterium]